MGHNGVIQYLLDKGGDLAAHDLGKKNDGAFGSSNEPLMPIGYAIGVGTFVPNNAVIIHEDAVALMAKAMKERGIAHTTSECTLRGFTCSQVKVDPKVAVGRAAFILKAFITIIQVDSVHVNEEPYRAHAAPLAGQHATRPLRAAARRTFGACRRARGRHSAASSRICPVGPVNVTELVKRADTSRYRERVRCSKSVTPRFRQKRG